MSEASAPLAHRLAMRSHARRTRRGQRALLKGRVLRVLVADLVAARTVAGMTQHEVAMRMWTTKSAVSRLEPGRTRALVRRAGARARGVPAGAGCARHGRPGGAFTVSDFNRTFRIDANAGTDPAWGDPQLVLCGAERGGTSYGSTPDLALGGPDDASDDGAWIPARRSCASGVVPV